MASEMNLSKVNVFPSETVFENNKGSVSQDELSIVKLTNLEIPGYVLSNGYKLLPVGFKNMTILTDVNQGSGIINLSQPYTNFDGLYFVFGDNSENNFHSVFISTWDLTRMIAFAKSKGTNKQILLTSAHYYWSINASTSTTTELFVGSENSYFYQCYGITL